MSRSKPPRRNRPQAYDSGDHQEGGETNGAERLQKVLAAAGIGSRRDCEELIKEGRVEVDRQVVTELGTKVDPLQHEIRVDGMPIRKPKRMYFVVNKPMGVVTTNFDPSGRMRVIDLVPTEERVFPVGRLDRYSEGLIIVTNDGEFANRLTHPRYGVEKTYLVRVAGEPDQTKLAKLKRGIHLSDGFCQVQSIKVKGKRGNSTDMFMVLNEGRNREIRRVLAKVGHKVLRLKRIAVGTLKLADLPTGAWRKLLPNEIESLLEDSHRQEQKAKAAKPQRDKRRQERPAVPIDEEMDETLPLASDHVAEDEEQLGDDEFSGIGGMLGDGGDDELMADGDFGPDEDAELLAGMDDDGSDEDFGDEDDEDFEIVEISDDEIERPRRPQPTGDVLSYDDDEADFDESGDDEALGTPERPRRSAGPPRRPAGSGGGRGAAGREREPGGPRREGGRAGGGPRPRGGAGHGDPESRRPGTRRKVRGEGRGETYRGGFGSRPARGEGDSGGEGRSRRPAGRHPAGGRPSGRPGGAGRPRFGERSEGRGEGASRGPGGRPAGRAPGKRTGPASRGPGARGPGGRSAGQGGRSTGPGGRSSGPGRPSRGGPGGGPGRSGPGGRGPSGGRPGGRPGGDGRPGGSRPGGGPGGRGPSSGGPRGRGPGSGGPRKGGPRQGGPRR